jgi:hypothetical protein
MRAASEQASAALSARARHSLLLAQREITSILECQAALFPTQNSRRLLLLLLYKQPTGNFNSAIRRFNLHEYYINLSSLISLLNSAFPAPRERERERERARLK